jgi:hypothetical protein
LTDSRFCYVIMPFKKRYISTHKQVIQPAFLRISHDRGEAWECRRADDAEAPGCISKEIVKSLHDADLVIADLSGNNPNVLYELGLAHSFGRPTILITQDIKDLPFDIKDHRVLTYSDSDDGLKSFSENLIRTILSTLSGKEPTSNPVLLFAPIRHAEIILALEAVRRQERSVRREVWLIEPSLDTDLKMFSEVIRKNLERGVKYRYLLPESPGTKPQLDRLCDDVGFTPGEQRQLEIRTVDRHLIESEVVIYDPYTEWEDVLLMSPRESNPVFWYRVGKRRGEDIRERYEVLWKKHAAPVSAMRKGSREARRS